MYRTLAIALVGLVLGLTGARAEDDSKFVAGNLSYSRDFYAKVHFVAVASAPATFKFDRYPSNGPERIQTSDGTYLRQHGQPWRGVDQPIRSGLPLTYAENDRYVMSFA